MFKSITVKNFRCFEEITVDRLERVNLIGGVNNIGKTALLESIYLLTSLDSLEIPLKLNFDRGVLRQQTFDLEEICEWLFYGKNINKNIKIKVIHENDNESELKLSLDKASSPRLFPLSLHSNRRRTLKDLKIEFTQTGQEPFKLTMFFTADREDPDEIRIGIQQEETQKDRQIESFPPSELISSRLKNSPTDDAEKFSNFEAVNKQDQIVEILKIIEPRLKRLAVLVTGGVPMVYGDVGGDCLIPISLMGEGMARLLSIILSIMNAQGGTILIDEIENGIHYSVLDKIWQSIDVATQKSNTQLFATTHSLECIKAAHKAFSQSESYDFRYYRLERDKETNLVKTLIYDKDTIETSVDLNLEMR
jgi:AAA15 family ATPase/GTPase